MNKFYVLEGNKRVSVLKYFDAVSIAGNVIRIMPPKTDDLEVQIYYEYADFYELSEINYLYFTNTGCFENYSHWWERNRAKSGPRMIE